MIELFILGAIVWWAQSLGKPTLWKRFAFGLLSIVMYFILQALIGIILIFFGMLFGLEDVMYIEGTDELKQKTIYIISFSSVFIIGIALVIINLIRENKASLNEETSKLQESTESET